MDIRKIAIIFVIGALFALFAFSTIDAIIVHPRDQYCNEYDLYRPGAIKPLEECGGFQVPAEEQAACSANQGWIIYDYDESGCPSSYRCSCKPGYSGALASYEFLTFLLYTIFATIGIAIGVFLPLNKNPLHEWVGTGFMLGGFICLFIGTARYFGEMNRFIRPIIILVEMALIIWLSYKKLGDIKAKK